MSAILPSIPLSTETLPTAVSQLSCSMARSISLVASSREASMALIPTHGLVLSVIRILGVLVMVQHTKNASLPQPQSRHQYLQVVLHLIEIVAAVPTQTVITPLTMELIKVLKSTASPAKAPSTWPCVARQQTLMS